MKILAIETSGKTFSTALNEDEKTVAAFYYEQKFTHSEMIIPAVERLLKDSGYTFENMDRFAVSIGPGSFTGIRLAISAIKTFAQILNKPVVAIDSLSILEKSFVKIKGIKIVAAIDALRNEIYIKENEKIIIKNIDLFIKDLKKHKNKILVIGNATMIYRKKLTKGLGKQSVSLPYTMHMPKAQTLATLAYQAKTTNYKNIQPLYIRRSWAEEIKKNL
ncbi:MAG: tRNA (adenosine(37)-N6)-threonylcarbamoyltransferase complex dimerization subunit type 1 TsaB [Endomicrobium sp.]|jgi:tRNA threonylcarbamoyl adenosine modification protein YeaZ|nr:tRNA (adenosine(37)-N6)-threonylcarbamoyltransferase complex dimerization subunit type 1 TsaB [Endomicrobium sp.]